MTSTVPDVNVIMSTKPLGSCKEGIWQLYPCHCRLQLTGLFIRVSGKSEIFRAVVVPAVKVYRRRLLIFEAENQLSTTPNSSFKGRKLKISEMSFRTIRYEVCVFVGLLIYRIKGSSRISSDTVEDFGVH
jgi:hypothetical protein